MTTKSVSKSELWLGLAAGFAFGLGGAAFGFDHAWRFCLFAVPALVVSNAMKRDIFPSVVGRHELVRATHPRAFWIAVGLCVALTGAALWFFVEGLQR